MSVRQTHTLDLLETNLRYDPETGIFRWKTTRNNFVREGSIAGCIDDGYIEIRFDGIVYQAHRLAWYFMYGEYPKQVDHKNRKRDDNRICNLRLCTHTQNTWNQAKKSSNKSGYKGVYWKRGHKKYAASIRVNGKPKHLGYFDDSKKAALAYNDAAMIYFGEFAKLNEVHS